jgi:penicillin-binding protein 2
VRRRWSCLGARAGLGERRREDAMTTDKDKGGREGPKVKSVLVNSMAYRQREEMLVEPEAGRNVVLTLDLTIQEATEKALNSGGPQTRGAAVVMEVRSGDILAMASSPTFDPNVFLGPIPHAEWQRLNDPKIPPWFNNAAYGRFQPGSIFKIIVGLAGLESGILNPDEIYEAFFRSGELQKTAARKSHGISSSVLKFCLAIRNA